MSSGDDRCRTAQYDCLQTINQPKIAPAAKIFSMVSAVSGLNPRGFCAPHNERCSTRVRLAFADITDDPAFPEAGAREAVFLDIDGPTLASAGPARGTGCAKATLSKKLKPACHGAVRRFLAEPPFRRPVSDDDDVANEDGFAAVAERDGMNLVAKQQAAAQDARNRCVLALSCFLGAADALLANPYDGGAVAETTRGGLTMPMGERWARRQAMTKILRRYDITAWQENFVRMLPVGPTAARA